MSDEQTNVDAGSETSGNQTEASQETASGDTAAETTEQSEGTAQDAGGAADETADTPTATDADESRTAFVTGVRPGDECTCPDGRKGTVHSFDTGLVCIPNADQG